MPTSLRLIAAAVLMLVARRDPGPRPRHPRGAARRDRAHRARIPARHPEVLQEAIAELEKSQAAAEAEKIRRPSRKTPSAVQFEPPCRRRQPAGRRHVCGVFRLQLRLLQARHGRHVRPDEGGSQAQGRAQGIPRARRRSMEAARSASRSACRTRPARNISTFIRSFLAGAARSTRRRRSRREGGRARCGAA